MMAAKISQFKFRVENTNKVDLPCIELDGDNIHTITDLSEFYKYLGYNSEVALKGILPDEFIWDTYIKKAEKNCASCFQLHIIDFLLRYSTTFTKKYGRECYKLIVPHTAEKAACNIKGCKARKFVNPMVG